MIPKTIHYCWFGYNPKPKLAEKCIKSWKKYCPDYEIIEWNEDNFDISSAPLYVRQAYEAKKWAFVTDYVRLKVVYDHGGIYLDTDVELIKSLDQFLHHNAYFGFEDGIHVATGLGFGAKKDADVLAEMMEDYHDIPFVLEDGTYDTLPCPQRNTTVLLERGLVQDNSYQELPGFVVYPEDVFSPFSLQTMMLKKSKKTVSIHWFAGSWMSTAQREYRKRLTLKARKQQVDYILHTPHRFLLSLLGEQTYQKLKQILKRGQ